MTTSMATVAWLEERIGKASALVHMKSIDHLDRGALDWVGSSPLMFADFADAAGIGVTLGGGRPGWAAGGADHLSLPASLLDQAALARPGARFGSFFMIPSISELMRINGRVEAVTGEEIRIRVEECYFHCGKALIRSEFWQALPGLGAPDDLGGFAGACRFLALATVDAGGRADLSPKGDPADAMVHLDDRKLWFADRPGNKRIDSFRNIVTQPTVAAALVIPGATRVVLLSGTARISDDERLRGSFAVHDKTPALVTGIDTLAIDMCESAALARAAIWPAQAAPAHISPAKIGVAHLKLNKGLGAKLAGAVLSVPGLMEKGLQQDYKKNLY